MDKIHPFQSSIDIEIPQDVIFSLQNLFNLIVTMGEKDFAACFHAKFSNVIVDDGLRSKLCAQTYKDSITLLATLALHGSALVNSEVKLHFLQDVLREEESTCSDEDEFGDIDFGGIHLN